jgi:uncharacterized protein YndB with AHSA1/START domain
MLIWVLLVLAVVGAVLLISVAMRPDNFRVTRSLAIAAPPGAVFPYVNELRRWALWSPWDKIDPALKRTYEGPPSGVGAIYRWEGIRKVGHGNMTITESQPPKRIQFNLEFLKPFKASHTAEFTFEAKGNQTLVTWSIAGKCNFMTKAMHLVMDMDKMIGGDFEKGLAQLKSVVESHNFTSSRDLISG